MENQDKNVKKIDDGEAVASTSTAAASSGGANVFGGMRVAKKLLVILDLLEELLDLKLLKLEILNFQEHLKPLKLLMVRLLIIRPISLIPR